jgi:hypothetical protein
LGEASESDNAMRSLARILWIAVRGPLSAFKGPFTKSDKPPRKFSMLSIARLSLWLTATALLMWKLLIAWGVHAHVTPEAQAVALHNYMLTGHQAAIDNLRLLAKQVADAGLHWAQTDRTTALWNYASASQGDGTSPINIYFRALSSWTDLTLWFAQMPWLAAVVIVGLAFLLAMWMRQGLRARARARLRMTAV